jgi:hypothetical protein
MDRTAAPSRVQSLITPRRWGIARGIHGPAKDSSGNVRTALLSR